VETTDWAAVFDRQFSAPPTSVEARVGRAVLGDEYPEELAPYSFVSRSELRRFAEETRLTAGDMLVDVGCGRGGPGLWVAAQSAARYTGIDIAPSAVQAVAARAPALRMQGRVEAAVDTFEDTGLRDASADAIMSIDALLFTPDKRRAVDELARVLRRGGRLVFTSWDYSGQPPGRPPQVDDHRPLLATAGFRVLAYDDTEDWRGRMTRYSQALMDAAAEVAAETGEDVEALRHDLAEQAATADTMIRRFLAVAERV